jgi:hypothetical protein
LIINVFLFSFSYEYSHTTDRFWRKTRSRNAVGGNTSPQCVGTDPNRNWGYHWGGVGASTDPCEETYRGKGRFSEPETRAVKNFLSARANLVKVKI